MPKAMTLRLDDERGLDDGEARHPADPRTPSRPARLHQAMAAGSVQFGRT